MYRQRNAGSAPARSNGDAALIAEPTDLHVWLATLGVIWFELTVVGRPAYVGQAGAYVNAIEKACDVVVALRAIPEELNRAFSHPLFPSGAKPLTLNIGRIHGGDWASNVPLECTITGRMSFPIDWPVERAQRLLEERVAQHAASDPWLADHPPAIHYPGFRAAGWQADPDQPLLQLLDQVVRAVVGEPLTRTVFAGTADARYFGPSGGVVFFGPAGGHQHAPDEYLDLDSFVAAARIIALLMAEWCSQERQ
jgi:acetylornithine deacetylase